MLCRISIKIPALFCFLTIISGCGTLTTEFDESGNIIKGEKVKYPEPGITYITDSPQHGYQISYLGTDNRYWLWYPGNRRLLTGTWEATSYRICFRYTVPTYNPASRVSKRAGQASCTLIGSVGSLVFSSIKGDFFHLSSGKLPYRRMACDNTGKFALPTVKGAFKSDTPCGRRRNDRLLRDRQLLEAHLESFKS